MGYEIALSKAWDQLINLNPGKKLSVRFLGDNYDVDLIQRRIISASCNIPAKDFTAILILHYLTSKLRGACVLSGQWFPFKEIAGIEGYLSAFRKRAIEPIIRKYSKNPEGIFSVLERLPAQKATQADASIIIEVFEDVPVLICLWGQDEEFNADANIFFDKNIINIFCIEDIVVLAGIVATSI